MIGLVFVYINMMEHGDAFVGLLYLPVVVIIFLAGMDFGDRQGYPLSVRFMNGFRSASGGTKLAALLMAMTSMVHLTLIPSHSGEPLTALLFAVNGIALAALAQAALAGIGRWRPAAAVLLTASMLTYAVYLVAGLETPDVIGVATKTVEFGALILIVIRPVDRFVSIVSQVGSR